MVKVVVVVVATVVVVAVAVVFIVALIINYTVPQKSFALSSLITFTCVTDFHNFWQTCTARNTRT